MRILTLDVGNSTIDACLFEKGKLIHIGSYSHTEAKNLIGIYDLILISSVKKSLNSKFKKIFSSEVKFFGIRDIPIEIDYRTPQTLGVDRLLFAYGVKELYSLDAVLVMAGTALVVDLLSNGVFKGGFITAGLGFKLRTLSKRAEGLPFLDPYPLDRLVGKSTEECLLAGTFIESKSFIEQISKRWSKEFKKDLPIYITGGEGKFFKDLGVYDPLILHKAMLGISGIDVSNLRGIEKQGIRFLT